MDPVDVAMKLGVPSAILAVVALGLWKAARWVASDVVRPIVDSHVELIKTLQQNAPEHGRKLDAVANKIDTLTGVLGAQTPLLQSIDKGSKVHARQLAAVSAKLDAQVAESREQTPELKAIAAKLPSPPES